MHYKAIFISDVHLGTKAAKSKKLLQFLEANSCDTLFLVGDIIDGWALQRKHHWSDKQTEVIRKILKISMISEVIYLPGNHDDFIRPFFHYNFNFGSIKVTDRYEYSAIDGRRILVVHGDSFDFWMRIPKRFINMLAKVGDLFSVSIAEKARQVDQSAYRYLRVTGTEAAIRKYCKLHSYDSVICGHTHQPKIIDGYMNCGDWVQHCTAIVETVDGSWTLLQID